MSDHLGQKAPVSNLGSIVESIRRSDRIRLLIKRLGWIAGGTAFSRGSVALALLASSAVLPLEEFGQVGVYLAMALMVTQTVSYSFSLYILKSHGMAGWPKSEFVTIVATVSTLSGLIFVGVAGLFLQQLHIGYLLSFVLYVFGNSCLQCMVAALQGKGDFASPTTISGAVATLAAALSVFAAWAIGGIAFIAVLAAGFVLAALILMRAYVRCPIEQHESCIRSRSHLISEGAAIGASGLLWGGFAAWLISDLSRVAGLGAAAYYAFGAQYRSMLAFIPGILGVYLLSSWGRRRHDPAEKREVLSACLGSGSTVLVVALAGLMVILLGRDLLGLKAASPPVLMLSAIAAVLLAGSTPIARWISVTRGDWSNAMISALSVLAGWMFAMSGDSTPEWRTAAFLMAYFVQLASSVLLLVRQGRL